MRPTILRAGLLLAALAVVGVTPMTAGAGPRTGRSTGWQRAHNARAYHGRHERAGHYRSRAHRQQAGGDATILGMIVDYNVPGSGAPAPPTNTDTRNRAAPSQPKGLPYYGPDGR